MKKMTIEKLWYSNFMENTCGDDRKRKKKIKELFQKREMIKEKMDENGQLMLEQYDEAVDQLEADFEKEAFMKGVRFAVSFLMEALSDHE